MHSQRSSCSSCDHHRSNSFSMLFAMPYDQHISCPYHSNPSSVAVDCTLSLATPSTRLTSDVVDCDSRFSWDFLQSDDHTSGRPAPSQKTIHGGATVPSAVDTLLVRRCASCDTTSTPLWRNGPRGPKSLCNACGIRFKKEERRATTTAVVGTGGGGGGGHDGDNGNMWMQSTQVATAHKVATSWYTARAVGGEYRYVDEVDDRDSTRFMSWRLNVTDRAGLVHDFTRY